MKRLPLLALLLTQIIPAVASANPDLDRRFALERLGYLRAWDNVDGFFADLVDETYRAYFARDGRFVLQELGQGDAVFAKSKIPYAKIIEDAPLLGQLARATRAESMLRTRVVKEPAQYKITIDWLHSPGMELLASDSAVVAEAGPAGAEADFKQRFARALEDALGRVFGKLPYLGQVTGRDGPSVTLAIARPDQLRPGDRLSIATVEEVKRHPLLKAYVDWKLAAVGVVEVEQVDERIVFARVVEEDVNRPIGRWQKVNALLARPVEAGAEDGPRGASGEAPGGPREIARTGFATATLGLGTVGRGVSRGTTNLDGGGLAIGGGAEVQLWINQALFGELEAGAGFWSHSQGPVGGSGVALGSGTFTRFRFNAGYNFLTGADFFGGPRGWLKLGYQTTGYSLPASTTDLSGPASYGGIFLGIGGDLPIRGEYGALVDLRFGVFSSGSQSGFTTGSGTGASDAAFCFAGYKRITDRIRVKVGLDIRTHSASFQGSGVGNEISVSSRSLSLGPSLLYYF